MTGKLPPSASVAAALDGAKLHAPAAARNAEVLCDLLREHAPPSGHALEIASGTGQHVIAFAAALPNVIWQPSEVDAARLASIDAYAQEAQRPNVAPAVMFDATRTGWHREHGGKNLVLLVNLLHLIGARPAMTLLTEAIGALVPGGTFVLYGPFKRDGVLTSAGDERFDADLRSADPDIGYKDDTDVLDWLRKAGAVDVKRLDMPANNLALIATKA